MRVLSGSRTIKFVLLACFLGWLILYGTAGQVLAAPTQASGDAQSQMDQCRHHGHHDGGCDDNGNFNFAFTGVETTCDSFDAQNNVCAHYKITFLSQTQPPDSCASFDVENQVCRHFHRHG